MACVSASAPEETLGHIFLWYIIQVQKIYKFGKKVQILHFPNKKKKKGSFQKNVFLITLLLKRKLFELYLLIFYELW